GLELTVMRPLLLFAIWMSLMSGVFASPTQKQSADAEKEKQRKEYGQEMAKLKREDPAKFAEETRFFVVMAQYTLAALGYGIGPFTGVLDEKTREAVGAYQKVSGFTVTGEPWELDTLQKLFADFELLKKTPVSLPSLHVSLDF